MEWNCSDVLCTLQIQNWHSLCHLSSQNIHFVSLKYVSITVLGVLGRDFSPLGFKVQTASKDVIFL